MQTYTISLLNSAICSFATTIAVAALRYQVHIAKIFYLWFQKWYFKWDWKFKNVSWELVSSSFNTWLKQNVRCGRQRWPTQQHPQYRPCGTELAKRHIRVHSIGRQNLQTDKARKGPLGWATK